MFILVLVILLSIKESPTTKPQPTPNPYSPTHGVPYSIITPQDQEELNRDRAIASLIQKLPYTGKDFSLAYDISENKFTVTYNSANKEEGQIEFENYLHTNGISDPSWLYNLSIQY